MNPKKLVKLSNFIGTIAIILLVYWVFTFIIIQVFGLKVFKENITESFYMSILGILALMFGALIINVMFNLTRIAEKHNQDENLNKSKRKNTSWLLLAGFPIILLLLFGGDYFTSKRKEKLLIESATAIINNNVKNSAHLVDYAFTNKWLKKTDDILEILSATDKNFPHISIIVKDTIYQDDVFLSFSSYDQLYQNDTIPIFKKNYLRRTTQQEREYLHEVFVEGSKDYRYSSHDGTYELFFPYFKDQNKIIIYFSEYQRYGKFGS